MASFTERPTLPSIKTTSDENFAFLYQLGYNNATISNCWKKFYNKKEKGRCQVCFHKMEMPKQVIKFFKMPYHKNKHYPPGHFIFNEPVDETDPNVWENIKAFLDTKSNNYKTKLLIPVCYQCFNDTKNYTAHSLIEKSQTVNYNKVSQDELNDQQKQEKIEYNYQYQFNWYHHYGYCVYTENAVKFCGCRNVPGTLTCPKHQEYQIPQLQLS